MLLFIAAYMELLLQTSGSLPASTNPKLRCGRLSGHKHLGIFGLGEEGEKAKTTSPQKKATHIKDKTTKTKHEANPQGQLLNNSPYTCPPYTSLQYFKYLCFTFYFL